MKKNLIGLTKYDLVEIVKESLTKIFSNNNVLNDNIDIRKIPIDILRIGYFDYRLTPFTSYYGNSLYNPSTIKEAVGDILPPDTVVREIINKYSLPPQFITKREHYHNIYIYAITAVIGINDKIIEDDMKKMGYFLSKRGDVVKIQGMAFQVLQFEPLSQLQEDITDKIKEKYNRLYHWTPSNLVDIIMKEGLMPKSKNFVFNYPPRIYLMEGDSTDAQKIYLGRLLCAANNSVENNGDYTLLSIDVDKLDDKIRFFYDPNSEIGIYTEHPIPKDSIKVEERVMLKKPSK